MDNISQKSINEIVKILRESTANSNSKQRKVLADELEKAEIIPALYVMTYLQAVNTVRKNTQSIDDEKNMVDDYDKFVQALDHAHTLEMGWLIDDERDFKTIIRFVHQALDRKTQFCDWNDSRLPKTKIGRCEFDEHNEYCDEPLVPLTEVQQITLDRLRKVENFSVLQEKQFQDNYNPEGQELEVLLGWNEESHKLNDDDAHYICKTCMGGVTDNAEGDGPSCDMDSVS